jgi:lipopolysaccharide transport system ATP-binding protein
VVQAPFRRLGKLLRGQAYGVAEMDETIWALKDVSFEACPELSRRVQRGEVVGVPALRRRYRPQRGGEDHVYFDRLSTRLKVLSRITEPTEGAPRSWRAEIHGRVGSLLEVGTGFHLTGIFRGPGASPTGRLPGRGAGSHVQQTAGQGDKGIVVICTFV